MPDREPRISMKKIERKSKKTSNEIPTPSHIYLPEDLILSTTVFFPLSPLQPPSPVALTEDSAVSVPSLFPTVPTTLLISRLQGNEK